MRNTRVSKAEKLSYGEKFSRLGTRLRDPKWRRYGMLLLAGKALGIVALFALITIGTSTVRSAWEWMNPTDVHAQETAPASPASPLPGTSATACG